MRFEPEIWFNCLSCRASFGITLSTIGETSRDDIRCLLCGENKFMAATRMYEDEER